MIPAPTKITFFTRFIPLILEGKKTITIRDESESHYLPDSIVDVFTFESNQWVGKIKIISIEPILFSQLNEFHAQQESFELEELKAIIRDIYPNTEQLYVLSYQRLNEHD